MAIHYDKKTGRFKDDHGRFIAKAQAMRSSIARKEYENATRPKPAPTRKADKASKVPAKPKPASGQKVSHAKLPPHPERKRTAAKAKPAVPKPAAVPARKKKRPAKAPASVKPLAPSRPITPTPRTYPPHIGEQEGIIDEFPEQWFPDPGTEDDFDWDDIEDIWGDYEDADTTSAGPDGGES